MPNEKEWVDSFIPDLRKKLQIASIKNAEVRVESGHKLPYAFEVLEYASLEPSKQNINQYETDVLIFDQYEKDLWVPRVVVECKLRITTHDVLTYSSKSATHKNVHPYLRYGILIGNQKNTALPWRLVRHGANFDFMASWEDYEANDDEWHDLMDVLVEEVKASRKLQAMLKSKGPKPGKKYSIIHRPLKFKGKA